MLFSFLALSFRCEVALGEFLKEIKKTPANVKFAEMANILVIHCQASGTPALLPVVHPLLSVRSISEPDALQTQR